MSENKEINLDNENKNNSEIISPKHLRHFLDIENLPQSLILDILDLAESFAGVSGQPVKKVSFIARQKLL